MNHNQTLVRGSCRLHQEASLCYEQGRIRRAEGLFRRALHWLEHTEDPAHPDVAAVLNELAGIHEERSQYREAEADWQ